MSKFKVGDKVVWSGFSRCGTYDDRNGDYMVITDVAGDGTYYHYDIYSHAGEYLGACYECSTGDEHGNLKLMNEENSMSEEKQELPEFVIITKNTEMFKKGGVFKSYSSFWAPVDANEAYHVSPYDTKYISSQHAEALLAKKIAVPAVQFDPAFVTHEQNEVLQKALDGMKKKPTKKKTTAKATTKKA